MLKILKETLKITFIDLKTIFTNKKFYLAFLLAIIFLSFFSGSIVLILIFTSKMENRFIAGLLSSLSISAMILWIIFALINLARILDKYNNNRR